MDGLPVSSNPPSNMWPILGYITNTTKQRSNVFIIGVYCGKSKPRDANNFLRHFVNEIKELYSTGIAYNKFL